MAQQIVKSLKGLKDYAGTAANAGIVLATGGIEQIATVALYRCPCVKPSLLGPGCNETMSSLSCTKLLNAGYGFSFIFAPAFALFAFGIAASPKLWKIITGCGTKIEKFQEDCQTVSWTLCSISLRGLVSPVTWMCIALLDGRYLACSLTPLPYVIGTNGHYKTCEDVNPPTYVYSAAFENNRTYSQVIGALSIVSLLFFGFFLHCFCRCKFPLTYHHAMYYELYRKHEQAEFEDEMNKKAQKKAEENVRKFLEARREKKLWDKISTVFQFHRDEKQLVLYSPLHELLQSGKLEKPLQDEEQPLIHNEHEDIPLNNLD